LVLHRHRRGLRMRRALLAAALLLPAATRAEPLPYVVEGDAIARPLTGRPGDPVRGEAVVLDRRVGLCLLCHSGPFAAVPRQGDLAPDLAGVGSRLDAGQLRLRLVDMKRLNPDSLMPAYYRSEGLAQVGRPWQGRPILTAAEIED